MPPADTPPTNTTPPPAAASDAIDPKDDALLNILFSSVGDEEKEKKSGDAQEEPTSEPGRTLFEVIEDKTPIIKKPKTDDKKPATEEKKETPAAAPAATAAPAPEEKPIRRRRHAAAPPAAVPAAPPAPTPDAKEKPDENAWEKDLLEEEREQLESARFAERKFPEKYKGLGDRVAKFLKEHKAKVDAADFDASDPAYQTWLQKNRPALSQQEVLRIERERTKEETLRDADAKLADVRDESWRLTHEPVVKEEANTFYRQAAKEALPQDLLEAINDKKNRGLEWARENMALETDIAETELNEAAANVETYLRLTTRNPSTGRAFAPYNPDDPAHKGAMTMLKEVCEEYKRVVAGRPEAVREGRSYVTRLEWAAMTPDQQKRHWTLSDKEVIAVYRARVKYAIASKIEAEKARYRRYFKQPASTSSSSAAPAPKKDDSPPPAPRPSAVPQGGGGGAEESDVDRFMNESLFGKPVN